MALGGDRLRRTTTNPELSDAAARRGNFLGRMSGRLRNTQNQARASDSNLVVRQKKPDPATLDQNQVAFPKHIEQMANGDQSKARIVEVTINEPVLIPSSEVGNPYKNAVSLIHDGIKSEIQTAYDALRKMKKRNFDVPQAAIEGFFAWWSTLEKALNDSFSVEEQVFYAQIENYRPMPMQLSTKERQLDKLEIVNNGVAVGRCASLFDTGSSTGAVRKLIFQLDGYFPKLLRYLHKKERYIPPMIKEVEKDCPDILMQLEEKSLRKVREMNAGILLVLWTRRLPPPELLVFKRRHFSLQDRRFYSESLRLYAKHRARLEAHV